MPGTIRLNPEIFNDKRDAYAVVVDEALRLWMEDTGFEPEFEITPEQEEFFRGTAYAEGEGTSAEKGGNVLGKLDPATWGGSGGKTIMRADTRTYRDLHPLKELRSTVPTPLEAANAAVGNQIPSDNPAVNLVNQFIAGAGTFGRARAVSPGGVPRVTYDSPARTKTGAPVYPGWKNTVGVVPGEPGVTRENAKWAERIASTSELESLRKEGVLVPKYAPGEGSGSRRQDKKMWSLTNRGVTDPKPGSVKFRVPANLLDMEKMVPEHLIDVRRNSADVLAELVALSAKAHDGTHPFVGAKGSIPNVDHPLQIDDQGNVHLTRVAGSTAGFSKGWVDAGGAKALTDTSVYAQGPGIPTSWYPGWGGASGGAAGAGRKHVGEFVIPIPDLLDMVKAGNATIGNVGWGEGEIVLNPAAAKPYLKAYKISPPSKTGAVTGIPEEIHIPEGVK